VANLKVYAALLVAALAAYSSPMTGYYQTNLVSNIPGLAPVTDAHLVNPWGMSQGPTPIWVSDNGTGVSTLYTGSGQPAGGTPPLVVTIPGGKPTGQVFNPGTGFNGDKFVFTSEAGTITGWRGALGTTAETLLDNSGSGAVYKGLAIETVGSDSYLFAADFHNNKIYVYPSSGAPALAGNFVDPNLPAGYAPFNVQNIGGQIYVAYAKQQAGSDDEEAGAGFGYVDLFNPDGTFNKRLVSNGRLNAPWGMAIAPGTWGMFSNSLLVGNFGDGSINAFDSSTGTFLGTVSDKNGNPLINDGLWGIAFGTGGGGTSTNSLYFTAGLHDEADGLFGKIQAVPEPGTATFLALGGAALALIARRKRSSQL